MVDSKQVDIEILLAMLPDPTLYEKREYGIDCYSYGDLDRVVDDILPLLRERVGNCPACIMAALRQKSIPVPLARGFHFKEECKEIWIMINEANSGH